MKPHKTSPALLFGLLTAGFLALSLNNIPLYPAEAALAPDVPQGAVPPEAMPPETTIPENAPLDFRVLDTDHDGSLNQEEFDAAHRDGPEAFKNADANKDESINLEEFNQWVGSIGEPKLNNSNSSEIVPQGGDVSKTTTEPKDNKDNCYPKSAEHPDGNGTCFFP